MGIQFLCRFKACPSYIASPVRPPPVPTMAGISFPMTPYDIKPDCILDPETGKEVMMSWEADLMGFHAGLLAEVLPVAGNFLEIGFGMGLFTNALLDRFRRRFHYTIIEPRQEIQVTPAFISFRGRCFSWRLYDWTFAQAMGYLRNTYDAIFYDAFNDPAAYLVPELVNRLNPGGRLSFFNCLPGKETIYDFSGVPGRVVYHDPLDVEPTPNTYFNHKQYFPVHVERV